MNRSDEAQEKIAFSYIVIKDDNNRYLKCAYLEKNCINIELKINDKKNFDDEEKD